jgi:hypothetical protein
MQWRRMTCCLVFIGSRERESVVKARQKQWEKQKNKAKVTYMFVREEGTILCPFTK